MNNATTKLDEAMATLDAAELALNKAMASEWDGNPETAAKHVERIDVAKASMRKAQAEVDAAWEAARAEEQAA